MLKIVIYDSSADDMLWLENELEKVVKVQKLNIQLSLVTNKTEDLERFITDETEVVFYILDTNLYRQGTSGIDIAKNIRKNDRESYIVFSSSKSEDIQMTLDGLIRPSGFLIKPIDKGDITTLLGDIYRDYLNFHSDCDDTLNVNIGAEMYRLEYDKIFYFEAYSKKVHIFTANQRIGYYDSLTSLEEKLGDSFVRCHRSYIVNIEKISKVCFSEMIIQLKNGVEINISRKYKNNIKEKLYGV